MHQQISFLQHFETFIHESSNGKRRTASGKRLTGGTIEQYETVKNYLVQFEEIQTIPLRIQLFYSNSRKLFIREKNYWKKRKLELEEFLRKVYNCYDVFIASVFKVVKTFFNYLKKEKGLPVGEFHKLFRLPNYSYQPVLVDTTQLQRLITDALFRDTLPAHLKTSLDVFIFGSVAGLRYNDLMRVKKTQLYEIDGALFLHVSTQKTGTPVIIPLPDFAVTIVSRYKRKHGQYLFRRLSNTNFNLHIKIIMEKAGYTTPLPKFRYRKGVLTELKTKLGKSFRFCDHMSAHTMRRTAITSLLMLGVPEQVVRKISGHAAESKEFFKYVSIAQDYTNKHLVMAYDKLLQKPVE